jgi:hypothetical protein
MKDMYFIGLRINRDPKGELLWINQDFIVAVRGLSAPERCSIRVTAFDDKSYTDFIVEESCEELVSRLNSGQSQPNPSKELPK